MHIDSQKIKKKIRFLTYLNDQCNFYIYKVYQHSKSTNQKGYNGKAFENHYVTLFKNKTIKHKKFKHIIKTNLSFII